MVSKEKQIEEMYNSLSEAYCSSARRYDSYLRRETAEDMARRLVEDGYRKQSEGEWIEQPRPYEDEIVCSVCGANFNTIDNCTEKFDFCPNCGAKMKGGEV